MNNKKKLRVFEAFAGIGAQHAALKRLDINYEVVGISEWFIDALECYDAIHFDGHPPVDLPDYVTQLEELSKYTFSKNSVEPYDIKRLSHEALARLYRANKRVKNYGSITEIRGIDMPEIDFLAYSFPCQDLSTGGKTLGMTKGSGTRSGLLWEIERILMELKAIDKLPKYLLLENVKAILAKSNESDLEQWKTFLSSIGYCNDEPMVLDASEFGIPQARKRVFMISCLGEKKDIYVSDLNRNFKYNLKNFIHSKQGNPSWQGEYDKAQLNPTRSRLDMMRINGKEWKEDLVVNTITCNMDRSNTSVMFDYNGVKGNSFRLLTIREAFLLMGFTNQDYERAAKLEFSYRKMNKLIGNSIVVNVLEEIFSAMFGEKYKK